MLVTVPSGFELRQYNPEECTLKHCVSTPALAGPLTTSWSVTFMSLELSLLLFPSPGMVSLFLTRPDQTRPTGPSPGPGSSPKLSLRLIGIQYFILPQALRHHIPVLSLGTSFSLVLCLCRFCSTMHQSWPYKIINSMVSSSILLGYF